MGGSRILGHDGDTPLVSPAGDVGEEEGVRLVSPAGNSHVRELGAAWSSVLAVRPPASRRRWAGATLLLVCGIAIAWLARGGAPTASGAPAAKAADRNAPQDVLSLAELGKGSVLTVKNPAAVFKSTSDWLPKLQLKKGDKVQASGPPVVRSGISMLPLEKIYPKGNGNPVDISGAVQMKILEQDGEFAPRAETPQASSALPQAPLPPELAGMTHPVPSFDCAAGFDNWKVGWSPEKKDWCCQNFQKGCPDVPTTPSQFDCDAQFTNWKAAWSTPKKHWCCHNFHRGCDTPIVTPAPATITPAPASMPAPAPAEGIIITPPPAAPAPPVIGGSDIPMSPIRAASPFQQVSFDCNAGVTNWQRGWSVGKKASCCRSVGKGCPPPAPLSGIVFDCNAGWYRWQTGWSAQKKNWCCAKVGRACPTTSNAFIHFDCNAGYTQWRTGWSQMKMDYCCRTASRGCNSGPQTWTVSTITTTTTYHFWTTITSTTSTKEADPFNCALGYANWGLGWSTWKKQWCCKYKEKGCPDDEVTGSAHLTCVDWNKLKVHEHVKIDLNLAIKQSLIDLANCVNGNGVDARNHLVNFRKRRLSSPVVMVTLSEWKDADGYLAFRFVIKPPKTLPLSSVHQCVTTKALPEAVLKMVRKVPNIDKVTRSTSTCNKVGLAHELVDMHLAKRPCDCEHGTPKEDDKCPREGGHHCASCNFGYTMEKKSCKANLCICDHGVPSEGASCPKPGAKSCGLCFPGWHIEKESITKIIQDPPVTPMPNPASMPFVPAVPSSMTPMKRRLAVGWTAPSSMNPVMNPIAAPSSMNPVMNPIASSMPVQAAASMKVLTTERPFIPQIPGKREVIVKGEDTVCRQNFCTCLDGKAAEDQDCINHDSNICVSCKDGFHLDKGTLQCMPNECNCRNGIRPDEGDKICKEHQGEACEACNSGFHLNTDNHKCEANRCECKDGIAASGGGDHGCLKDGDKVCISCKAGLHLTRSKTCAQPTCVCHKGQAATGADCPSNNGNICEKCDKGYKLEAKSKQCLKMQCTCSNGSPVGVDECDHNNADHCKVCDKGFKLIGNKCVGNTCHCHHGTAATGAACLEKDLEVCATCNSGYHHEFVVAPGRLETIPRCMANRCTCSNGHASTPSTDPVCTEDRAERCYDCKAGFTMNQKTHNCAKTRCTCSHGTAKTGTDCAGDNVEDCQSCIASHHLSSAGIVVSGTKLCKPNSAPPAPAFDCQAGKDRMNTGWSVLKKDWCCKNDNRMTREECCMVDFLANVPKHAQEPPMTDPKRWKYCPGEANANTDWNALPKNADLNRNLLRIAGSADNMVALVASKNGQPKTAPIQPEDKTSFPNSIGLCLSALEGFIPGSVVGIKMCNNRDTSLHWQFEPDSSSKELEINGLLTMQSFGMRLCAGAVGGATPSIGMQVAAVECSSSKSAHQQWTYEGEAANKARGMFKLGGTALCLSVPQEGIYQEGSQTILQDCSNDGKLTRWSIPSSWSL